MVGGAVSSAAVAGARAWDVIVGDRFIAAIAAPAPERVLTSLAEAAGDAALSLETLVGLIPSGRVDPVSSFGLVWWPDDALTSVTAVVRGDAVVDLASPGGSRRFDARGIRPWHLADFDDVVALRITDAAAPLDRIERAGSPVAHPRASLSASSVEWAAEAGPADAATTETWLDADTVLAPRLLRSNEHEVAEREVLPREADAHEAAADTIVTARTAERRRGSGRSDPSPEPGVESAEASEAETNGSAPVVPAQPVVPSGPRFRVGTGSPLTVTAPVLIGRRPLRPRVAAPGPQPELLAVASPASVVSGTHLELRLVGARLVATDLHSTNGTMLRTNSGARRLRSGESIVVLPGTLLDLGDDTIIEILCAQGAPGA
ncbi:FHA domain-containing protein [Agromyces sp. Root81]|uniref:FHA domain-containing protein n=1 Tax=Agromyces sp. Root81 TaxID=1736601 RepID=UPI00138F8B80|nr:FHA domain-containing protein [Agromyces sp. Root81]